MFFVGDTSVVAGYYWSAVKEGNPIVADVHWEEMSESQLRKIITYCRMAYNAAIEDGVRGEALEPLLEPYREVYHHLYLVSDQFREWVTTEGRVFHPVEFLEETSED